MATREKADAVIVGAGAAGAVFAAVLSRAGKHVVVLEQGPDWQLSDLISSDIWARRLRGSGPAIVYEGRHPVGRTADHGWGTGGAALHYSANFPRLLPSDFNMKSEHGRGLDWPISYTDVAPYYDRVAREIGVSGDAKAEERWRPPGAPYPMPPLKTFRHGEVWVPGLSSVGITVAGCGRRQQHGIPGQGRLYPRRLVRRGLPHRCTRQSASHLPWRGACQGRGSAGHELRDADPHQCTRHARDCRRVFRRQERATSARSEPGRARRLRFANPRLMFNSATDKHPNGLANASGLLGKYVMAHAGAGVSAIFGEDLQNYLGSFGYQFVSYDRHPKTSRKTAFGSTFGIRARRKSPPTFAASLMCVLI